MLCAWLIYGEEESKKNSWLIHEYKKEGDKLGIHIELKLVEELEIGIKNDHWFIYEQGKSLEYPDFAIVRAIYPMLNQQLEMLGIKTFNNSMVAEICNNKAKTYQYVAKLGIPIVDTVFCRKNELAQKLNLLTYKSVFKTVDGHGGSEVFLVDNNTKLDDLRQISSDFVIQPLVGSRHQDLRVYVIGKQIIAGILRTAKGGFKSNFSLGGDVCEYKLNEQEITIVKKIIELFDFGLVGIDFIIGDDQTLIFNEIEDVVGARMLYQCLDINLVATYLKFIVSSIKK